MKKKLRKNSKKLIVYRVYTRSAIAVCPVFRFSCCVAHAYNIVRFRLGTASVLLARPVPGTATAACVHEFNVYLIHLAHLLI